MEHFQITTTCFMREQSSGNECESCCDPVQVDRRMAGGRTRALQSRLTEGWPEDARGGALGTK